MPRAHVMRALLVHKVHICHKPSKARILSQEWGMLWCGSRKPVVYVYRAGNPDCPERGYDQPIDYLGGGADDAIRPCIGSRRERRPYAAGCPVSPALPRWPGHTL